MTSTDCLSLIVGGMHYSLLLSDIRHHPASYFGKIIKDEWRNSPVEVNRDGVLFQYIFMYICMDFLQISRRVREKHLDILVAIRAEADYYNLPKLIELCDEKIKASLPLWCKSQPTATLCEDYECIQNDCGTDPDNLANVYGRHFFPTVQTGSLVDQAITGELCKGCSIGHTDLAVLLQSAKAIDDNPSCDNVRFWWRQCERLNTDTVENIQVHMPAIGRIGCYLATPELIIVTEGPSWYNFCIPRPAHCLLGYVLYIIQAAESGGAVTVTQHGVTHRIQHAGEFIVCGRDSTRQVEQIAAGAMVCVLFPMYKHDDEDYYYVPPYPEAPLTSKLASQLIQAALRESGMVLCLRTLYVPVFGKLNNTLQTAESSLRIQTQEILETDPAALQGQDALLYTILAPHFDVTLVTVYVARTSGPPKNCQACILGLAPSANIINGNTEDSVKIKIVVPPYGFGNPFELQAPYERKCTTLLTGLYIRPKVGV